MINLSAATTNDAVLSYLERRAGLVLTGVRRSDVLPRIERMRRALGLDTCEQLLAALEGNERAFDDLIAQVTVGETYFFRDLAQLNAIRRVVLPTLLQRNGSEQSKFRFWSAGCSSGEEAYTLAILLEQEGLGLCSSILATDISRNALVRARKGEYRRWSFRGVQPDVITKYFQDHGPGKKVIDEIRNRVRFEFLNLNADDYPSKQNGTSEVDVILCRNVLIYFSSNAIKETAKKLYDSLADGGWLIAGPSDPPLWSYVPLEPVLVEGAVVYRRPTKAEVRGRERVSAKAPSAGIPRASRVSAPKPQEKLKAAGSRGKGRVPVPASDSPSLPAAEKEASAILTMVRNGEFDQAEHRLARALSQHPLSLQLHYVKAILFMAMDHHSDAITALRKLLYLDRSIAAAHFWLAVLFQKEGVLQRARTHFENAYRLALARPGEEPLSFAEGATASVVAASARARLVELQVQMGAEDAG